jgi:hypothetical protein
MSVGGTRIVSDRLTELDSTSISNFVVRELTEATSQLKSHKGTFSTASTFDVRDGPLAGRPLDEGLALTASTVTWIENEITA